MDAARERLEAALSFEACRSPMISTNFVRSSLRDGMETAFAKRDSWASSRSFSFLKWSQRPSPAETASQSGSPTRRAEVRRGLRRLMGFDPSLLRAWNQVRCLGRFPHLHRLRFPFSSVVRPKGG